MEDIPKSSIDKKTRRRRIWEKTGGICAHCGRVIYGNGQTIDHFVPKSEGGGLDYRNLMPLCVRCNKARRNNEVDPREFYPYAKDGAIRDCLEYKREWESTHKCADSF